MAPRLNPTARPARASPASADLRVSGINVSRNRHPRTRRQHCQAIAVPDGFVERPVAIGTVAVSEEDTIALRGAVRRRICAALPLHLPDTVTPVRKPHLDPKDLPAIERA